MITDSNTMVLYAIAMINLYILYSIPPEFGLLIRIWFGRKNKEVKLLGTKLDPISDPKVPIFSVLQMRAGEPC